MYNKKRDTNSMKSRLSIQAVLTWLNLGGGGGGGQLLKIEKADLNKYVEVTIV